MMEKVWAEGWNRTRDGSPVIFADGKSGNRRSGAQEISNKGKSNIRWRPAARPNNKAITIERCAHGHYTCPTSIHVNVATWLCGRCNCIPPPLSVPIHPRVRTLRHIVACLSSTYCNTRSFAAFIFREQMLESQSSLGINKYREALVIAIRIFYRPRSFALDLYFRSAN